jgi:hypothetical protein
MWYAVDLHCLNRVAGTKRTPLPPLKNLEEGAGTSITAGLKDRTEPWKEMDKASERLVAYTSGSRKPEFHA